MALTKKGRAKYYKHADKPGAGAKKRKSLKGQDKVGVVMGEFKRGTLRSSSGQKVTNPAQAKAIAMSEAGIAKPKPKKTAPAKKKTARRRVAKMKTRRA